MKKIYFSLILFSVILLIVISATDVLAQGSIINEPTSNTSDTMGGTVSEKCVEDGSCQLSDLMSVVIRVSQLILAISGSLALLAFIYGGVLFLTSSGNRNQVDKGKSVISGAVIGMIVVLTSWVIIGVVFQALGVAGAESFYKTDWFQN